MALWLRGTWGENMHAPHVHWSRPNPFSHVSHEEGLGPHAMPPLLFQEKNRMQEVHEETN